MSEDVQDWRAVLDGRRRWAVVHGDCAEVLKDLPADGADLILTDPPYFKVRKEQWDRRWDTPSGFLEWLGGIAEDWHRVMRPNGSLYCFASPRMAARVEVALMEWFNVLISIVWDKGTQHRGGAAEKESLRSWWPASERIIFAEHYGADNIAKGEAGYGAKCDELRGFVFEPIRAYLDGERERAGLTRQEVNAALGNFMAGHYFSRSQWTLPTPDNYAKLRELFNRNGAPLERDYGHLRREYEHLRREYDDLKEEFEALRRPFAVSASVQYTDVWAFAGVPPYPGRHPCEKPVPLLEHAILASSRPGALVLDTFAGVGSTGHAALRTGRRFIGVELDPEHHASAVERLARAEGVGLPGILQDTSGPAMPAPLFDLEQIAMVER